MALGQLPLLKRHIARGPNVGLTQEEIVEVFVQLTSCVGVPAVEIAMRNAKEIFEEQGIQFTPNQVYDSNQSVESLYQLGLATHQEHMRDSFEYQNDNPDSEEAQLEHLITEYHWGAIYNRPTLSARDRTVCVLSAMTVMVRYDRQIRNRIVGALRDYGSIHPSDALRWLLHHSRRHAHRSVGVHRAGNLKLTATSANKGLIRGSYEAPVRRWNRNFLHG